MDREQARRLIEESFARGSHTPCSWAEDAEAYIAAEQDKLRACLIEPFTALVLADDWAQKYCHRDPGPHPMHAIAHEEGKWLFHSKALGEFSWFTVVSMPGSAC